MQYFHFSTSSHLSSQTTLHLRQLLSQPAFCPHEFIRSVQQNLSMREPVLLSLSQLRLDPNSRISSERQYTMITVLGQEKPKASWSQVSQSEIRNDCADKENLSLLISEEFNTQPRINYCKRIGQNVVGRPQLLLVAFATSEDASWLIANAKQLRSSTRQWVRDTVYINANLTKEESKKAYQQRSRRRAERQREEENLQQRQTTAKTSDGDAIPVPRSRTIYRSIKQVVGKSQSEEDSGQFENDSEIHLVYKQPSDSVNHTDPTPTQ